MKSLHFTIRNIILLVVIALLIGTTISLARNRTQQSNTLSQTTSTPVTAIVARPQEPASTEPAATKTPTPRVYFATPIAGPTYTPTPIPTPIEVIEPGQAVNGYIFSEARLVPGTSGSYIELVEWLPDDPNKILVIRDKKSLEVIDVITGDTRLYSDGKTRVRNPVWLPARQAAAYLTSDENDYTKQYLWINNGEKSELVFTTAWISPLAVTPDGSGIILFDANWQLTQVGGFDTQSVKLATETQAYTPPGYNHGELYRVAQSPDRCKALYFNDNWVLLADFVTGSITPIDLTSLRTEDMPPIERVIVAVWDTASAKIAFNLASGSLGSLSNLFILEPYINKLRLVEDDLKWVGNVAWAPDGMQIINYTSTEAHKSGYGIGRLFFIDTDSMRVQPVAAIPDDALMVSQEALLWSPVGKYIVVTFADKPEHPGLYVIEVSK